MNIQAPPNLNPTAHRAAAPRRHQRLRRDLAAHAGLHQPEAPWPHVETLAATCAAGGLRAAPRLPIYPELRRARGLSRSGAPLRRGRRAGAAAGSRAGHGVRSDRVRGGARMPEAALSRSLAAVEPSLRRRSRASARRRGDRRRGGASRGRRRAASRSAWSPAVADELRRRAGRRRRHLRGQPQHQLHERLREGLHVLRLLAHHRAEAGLLPRRSTRSCAARSRRGTRRDRGLHPGRPAAQDGRLRSTWTSARRSRRQRRTSTSTRSRPKR